MGIDYRQITAQVDDEFSCAHKRREYRTKLASNGVTHYRSQCLRCGDVKPVKKADIPGHVRLSLKEIDDGLTEQWRDRRWKRHNQLVDEVRARQERAWWDAYNAYLLSPEWEERRRKVLERAGGVCEGCLEEPADQVHHLTYDHVLNEPLFDLVAVCYGCHESITPRMQRQTTTL